MKRNVSRVCIYSKDIQTITGRTERYARRLITKIKKHYAKKKGHLISVKEFCEYTGLSEDEVTSKLAS